MSTLAVRAAAVALSAGALALLSLSEPLEDHDTIGGAMLLFSPAVLALAALLPDPRTRSYALLVASGAVGVGAIVAVRNVRSNDDSLDAVVFVGTFITMWVAASLVGLFVWLVLRILAPRLVGRRR